MGLGEAAQATRPTEMIIFLDLLIPLIWKTILVMSLKWFLLVLVQGTQAAQGVPPDEPPALF
jgi:hypothetical protein